MGNAKTPSFVLEKKLLTSKAQEAELDKRMGCVHQMKIQLVKHARKQLFNLNADKRYKALLEERRNLPANASKDRSRINKELAALRKEYGLTQFQFRLWVQPLQHRYTKRIDSRTAQCIADDIWSAVDKYMFGIGKKLHIPKYDDILSVRSNDNKTGIMYRDGRILWRGMEIQVSRDKKNAYEEEALKCRVKLCKIVRKQFSKRWHYYVQLVLEGIPPVKHKQGTGKVGIDPGTGSMAVVSEERCLLESLSGGAKDIDAEVRRINRAMDRSRRAMNPDNYNEDGTIKKGRKRWKNSRHYRSLKRKRSNLYRRRAASLRCHHEAMANRVLELGNTIYTEDMSYRSLQKRSKKTTKNKKGRYNSKKRFGKSLAGNAPATFLRILDRKLSYSGRQLKKVNTRLFKASQYNHVTGEYIKKPLSRRYNTINGRWVQRDLYSAFLIMNSTGTLDHADREACIRTYEQFLINHDLCIDQIKAGTGKIPSSFGFSRAA